MIPSNLITPKGTNVPGKYRLCEGSGCTTYIACPYAQCFEHWKPMIDQKTVKGYKEWKECNCDGKYNTDTFKCAVCKVEP